MSHDRLRSEPFTLIGTRVSEGLDNPTKLMCNRPYFVCGFRDYILRSTAKVYTGGTFQAARPTLRPFRRVRLKL